MQKRLKYLEELGRHMDVHSYGKCLHNKEEPPAPEVRTQRQHKTMGVCALATEPSAVPRMAI